MNLTPQAFDFLLENRLKDSKEWYREHKEEHRKLVVEPFRDFVAKMQPYINEIDPGLSCDPKRISRIYRDTRFTKDKSVFRDNVWYSFMHGKDLYEGYPVYFLDASPRGFMYGCGYYKASTKSIEALRSLVLNHDKAYLKARKTVEAHKEYKLDCNPYKKNHFPLVSEKDLPWVNIRDFCVIVESKDFDLLFSDTQKLADEMGKRFIEMKPVYDFLMKAEAKVDRTNK